MPKINGRSVKYSRTGIAKAKRAKAAGKKVTGLSRRTPAGGSKRKATKLGGAKAAGRTTKAGGANKRKTLRRARAAGQNVTGSRARNWASS